MATGFTYRHYILKDHLGSWTTITDAEGNVEQELSFDAWGNLRDADTWTGTGTEAPMFDRGYTGHEHMTAFGLINMNGRCYDPLMSSFLSVDEYVQDPTSAQNFNRYAYCLNNPLKYTDPSGWFYQGGSHSYACDQNAERLVTNNELYAEQYERFFGQKENHKAYYMEGEEQKGGGGAGGGSESPDDDWIYDKVKGEYVWDDNAHDDGTTPDDYEYVGPSLKDVKNHFLGLWNNDYYYYWVYGIRFGKNITPWSGEISTPDGLSALEMWLESDAHSFTDGIFKISIKTFYDMINSPFSLFTGHTLAGHVLTTPEMEEAFVDVAPGILMKTMEVTGQVVKVSPKMGYSEFCEKVKISNYNQSFNAYQINNKTQQSVNSFNLFKNYCNYGKEIYKKYQRK